MSAEVDREALLCALVLAPYTFARNRFFALFTEPWARRIRSRAAQLRTIVRHFSSAQPGVEVLEMARQEQGDFVLRYRVAHLSLERTAMLEPLEVAAIRFALSRRSRTPSDEIHESMRLTNEDRALVEGALAKLGRRLGLEGLEGLKSIASESTWGPTES